MRVNEISTNFDHATKTKDYDVIGVDLFMCEFVRFLRIFITGYRAKGYDVVGFNVFLCKLVRFPSMKTTGYDVIVVNIFLRKLMRFLQILFIRKRQKFLVIQ